jgi:probable HAF family extracellular repeat protein
MWRHFVLLRGGKMKTNRKTTVAIAATLFALLATTHQLPAQELAQQDSKNHHQYKLIDLGTFGGPQSYVNIPNGYTPVLNDRGTVTGWADTSTPDPYPNFCFNEDCFVSHAFQSRNGVTSDLGVLHGGRSSQANWISANGLIAGISQNGKTDPLFAGFPEFRAVLWKNGRITDLGTLPEGGYESLANAVNSRGQVVGLATNTIPDNFSLFGTTQARAFVWQNGVMQDLGTLGGTDAVAALVNERGQIVGESYTSSARSAYCMNLGFALSTGAFLWEHGTMNNLGSFGGTCTFATDLNNQGQVVGLSTTTGDQFQHAFLWNHGSLNGLPNTLGGNNGAAIALNNAGDVVGWASLPGDQDIHASLWQNDSMTDLGTVDGDPCSLGSSINATGQVIGVSVPACDFSQSRAFLWEDGLIVDLNTLIPPDSTLYLTTPETINDRGEIAGVGLDSNGDEHAFLLIPCGPDDVEACQDFGQDLNASQSKPAPIASPATTATQPNLTPRGMATGSRARLARGFRSPAVGAPAIPHNLTTSGQNTYQIRLNWQEAWGQNQNGFNIYRCQGCSNPRTQGTKIASAGPSVLAYTDGSASNPLVESTTYTYQITAFNGGGESGPSNAASATTNREPAPTNLTSFAFRRGYDDIVRLSWTNNSSDDDSYHIERCAGATCTNFSEIAQTAANAISHTDYFQFAQGLTFRYRVRAHSPGGYSGYSNIRTQTLP